MLRKRILARVFGLLAGIVLMGTWVFGEVSVNFDAEGNYRYTSFLVEPGLEGNRFWTPVRGIERQRILNPEGDLFGDGRPALVDDPQSGSPLAVWPVRSGRSAVLVWSIWEENGWSPPRWVHSISSPFEDRDPVLAVDSDGQVHLVWWKNQEGRGIVIRSRFLGEAGWSLPRPISSRGIDARYPEIEITGNGPAVVFRSNGKFGQPIPLNKGIIPSGATDQLEKNSSGNDGLTDDPDVLP